MHACTQAEVSSFPSGARTPRIEAIVPAGGPDAGNDATIAQLKAQLERMNTQLKEEARLAESEKQELIRLQVQKRLRG
jgi:hypothetical protein